MVDLGNGYEASRASVEDYARRNNKTFEEAKAELSDAAALRAASEEIKARDR